MNVSRRMDKNSSRYSFFPFLSHCLCVTICGCQRIDTTCHSELPTDGTGVAMTPDVSLRVENIHGEMSPHVIAFLAGDQVCHTFFDVCPMSCVVHVRVVNRQVFHRRRRTILGLWTARCACLRCDVKKKCRASYNMSLRSYRSVEPLFTSYTHQEKALLRIVTDPDFVSYINRRLRDHLGYDRAPMYTSESIVDLFESYASSQWPEVNADPHVFVRYALSVVEPVKERKTLTAEQRARSYKLPQFKCIGNYPEVMQSSRQDLPEFDPR